VTKYHLALVPPSVIANLITQADVEYNFFHDWFEYFPFISPEVMKKLLNMGVSCQELLAAERAVAGSSYDWNYDALVDPELLLNQTSPEQQAIVRANLANSGIFSDNNYNASTGLSISRLAGEDASSVFLLYALFLAFGLGWVIYRNAQPIITYCSAHTIFGDRQRGYQRVSGIDSPGPGLDDEDNDMPTLLRSASRPA
jgi:hypothetical protein